MYIHPFHAFINLFPFLSFSVSSTVFSIVIFVCLGFVIGRFSLSYTLHSPFLPVVPRSRFHSFSIHFSIVLLAVYRALGSLFSPFFVSCLLLSPTPLAYLHSLVQLSSFSTLFLAIPVARRLPAVNFFGILISLFLLYFN